QLLTIIQKKAKTARRYVDIDRLELGNSEQKIATFLDARGQLTIETERPVLGVWAVFHYYIAFVTDEKTEQKNQVWVNLLTNDIDHAMNAEQNQIMYSEKAPYHYPIPCSLDMDDAFKQ